MAKWMCRVTGLMAWVAAMSVVAAGCSPAPVAESSTVSAEGRAYVLASAPELHVSVEEAAERAIEAADLGTIAVAGLICEPWDEGKATFLLGVESEPEAETPPPPPGDAPLNVADAQPPEDASADAAAPAHGQPGHDPDTCPFCKNSRKHSPMVIVKFMSGPGRVLEVDARELFGLKAGQRVIVQGNGSRDSLGNVVLEATGLYLAPAG